jgi:hypothetical protein
MPHAIMVYRYVRVYSGSHLKDTCKAKVYSAVYNVLIPMYMTYPIELKVEPFQHNNSLR